MSRQRKRYPLVQHRRNPSTGIDWWTWEVLTILVSTATFAAICSVLLV
jgi:hypothetical protein